ncbi:MAG: sugar transferase [Bacteroidota bacterium]
MKRIFDFFVALIGLVLLSPLWILIALAIVLDSKGGVLYVSKRVGQDEKLFDFFKFRTMSPNNDKSGITVGNKDPRITKVGYILRKYKLDEIPQLINVLKGDMSVVGPRPDIPGYNSYYKQEFDRYYQIKPGITSYSSIFFSNESELYKNSPNPEKAYIEKTIPKKVELDKTYFNNQNLLTDIKILVKTVKKVIQN